MNEITEYRQLTLDEYIKCKERIEITLRNMADDYITLGYLLRRIKDSEQYKTEGYTSFADFAKQEYGLSESAVSRCMAINMKFSIGGYSQDILPEYEGFGSSKLGEMLTMSDEDCRLIVESTTVASIREIKRFSKESNSEEVVEAQVVSLPEVHNDFEQIIIEYFRDKPELLNRIYAMSSIEDIAAAVNPSGSQVFEKKPYQLLMYSYTKGLLLRKICEKAVGYSWQQFVEAAVEIYKSTYTDPDTVWQNFYRVENDVMQVNTDTPSVNNEIKVPENWKELWQKGECPPNNEVCLRENWDTDEASQLKGKDECLKCWTKVISRNKILAAAEETAYDRLPEQKEYSCDGKCFYCKNENCNGYQDKREHCTYESDKPCNMYNAHEVALNIGIDCTEDCCNRCDKNTECGAACNYSRKMAVADMNSQVNNSISEDTDTVLNENKTEITENETEIVENTQTTEVYDVDYFLKEENDRLNLMMRNYTPKKMLERQKYIVAALAAMKCDLDRGEVKVSHTYNINPEEENFNIVLSCINTAWKFFDKGDYHNADFYLYGARKDLWEKYDFERGPIAPNYYEGDPKQPELPKLKNNEQRGDFIDNYESWPLWIDIPETGEKYYRYQIDEDVAIVVKVYLKHEWNYGKYTEKTYYGAEEYYLPDMSGEYHSKGFEYKPDKTKTFHECKTNRSTLIDFLKEYQKKG